MRLAWLTDIHLDFLAEADRKEFLGQLRFQKLDGVLVGGDIGVAGYVEHYLEEMAQALRVPVFFVLGNHDYYGGSIASVRARMARVTGRTKRLVWLTRSGPIRLGNKTALVGHDGWGDGGFGDGMNSRTMLRDFIAIEDFEGLPKAELLKKLKALGEEAAAHLRRVMPQALNSSQHVFVLTHVPPFREACGGMGEGGLPFFACKAVGEALIEMAERWRDRRITVLCGHTHAPARVQVAANLEVRAGRAEYGKPEVQDVLEVD